MLNAFFGALTRSQDLTPDALDWTDVTALTVNLTTATQTITGIEAPINLKPVFNNEGGAITLSYKIGAGSFTAIASGSTFSVSSGDVVSFRGTGGLGTNSIVSVDIKNASRGDILLDNFVLSWN